MIIGLRFAYLPLKDKSACCYGLKSVNGALVIDVNTDGLADRAGLKPGDLVVGLDGVYLDANTPLLRLIRDCPADGDVTMEIQDPQANRIIKVTNSR